MAALPLHSVTPMDAIRHPLEASLALQRAACLAQPFPSLAERRADLLRLKAFIHDHLDAIVNAISQDYGHRSRHETLFAEIYPVLSGIDHVLKHLKVWMRPQRRGVDRMNFLGASNRVIPQPLGVVGVIVPWNFPINLSFTGLLYIFPAGNRAMVKMSENSRHLARLLIEKSPAYFPREKLAFFDETGGVGIEFSKLKFDHLLFTGSSATGRSVMAAAATNLCPVTLELGGKSPALVCNDYDLRQAAERLLFVKFLNAGQICTTVDHVYLPRLKVAAFVEMARAIVARNYPSIASPDYTAIIDERSFTRIVDTLQEAEAHGATLVQLVPGPRWDAKTRKIAPHLVLDTPRDSVLRTREIFGPVLPVIGYGQIEEPIRAIQADPRPLAFYPFSNDRALIERLLREVMSGGVSVNDALFHIAQHELPFGGVGDSGMGHYHGHEGFITFSKMRPVFHQARLSALKFLYPPYGKFADRYLRFLTR